MPITFSTIASLNAARSLEGHSNELEKSSAKLASGNRIQSPGDDPSGLYRAGMLENTIRANQQAQRNVLDARSMVQVSENSLNTINDQLLRLRELSVIGSSDMVGPDEREIIDREAQSLKLEIDRIAQTTRYANVDLLNGSGRELTFQVGADNNENHRMTFAANADVTASNLGVDGVEMSDPDSSRDAIENIDQAIHQVQLVRAQTGAFQARLNSAHNQLSGEESHLTGALANIRDTDVAREVSANVSAQIKMRAAAAVLGQANSQNQVLLRLLEK